MHTCPAHPPERGFFLRVEPFCVRLSGCGPAFGKQRDFERVVV
jgi:hypothetical protein